MKYSEFKAEVEKLGYTFFENKYEVRILDNGACKLIIIDKTDTHVIDPNNVSYITLSHKDKTELLDLVCELAKTPLAEREEEKRYRLWLSAYGASDFDLYRTKGHGLGGTNLNVLKSVTDPLLIFTESEIAELDIDGFEKVEVLDGE